MNPTNPLPIPENLTPNTAMALYELLNEMAEALWHRYESELIELIIAESNQYPDSQQAFDFDDDLSF
jgi:hypothetical protein